VHAYAADYSFRYLQSIEKNSPAPRLNKQNKIEEDIITIDAA
jgi:hypothetical protein